MAVAKRDLRTVPELEGWETFPDAAEMLGISRQRFHQLAEKILPDGSPFIKTVRRTGRRHVTYFVRTAEVLELKRRREGGLEEDLWLMA